MPKPPRRSKDQRLKDLGCVQIDVSSAFTGASIRETPVNAVDLNSTAASEQPSLQLPAGSGPPSFMTHIMQREDYDCGLTSVAMAGGLTYEGAQSFDPRPKPIPPNRGLWAKEMIVLLDRATNRQWRVGLPGKKDCEIGEYSPPAGVDRGVMLTKCDPDARNSHWVAFAVSDNGEVWIFDPEETAPHPASEDCRYVRKLVLPKVTRFSGKGE